MSEKSTFESQIETFITVYSNLIFGQKEFYSSLRLPVHWSMRLAGPGPIANTVFEPGAI